MILNEFLLPLFICVVLPVLIVWMISRVRKNETDRRAEIMLKAIEAGVPVNPDLFKKPEKSRRSLKQDLLDRLTGALVTTFMGAAFLTTGIVFKATAIRLPFFAPSNMIVTGAILLAIGIALFIAYSVSKKTLAKEIEAEEKHLAEKE